MTAPRLPAYGGDAVKGLAKSVEPPAPCPEASLLTQAPLAMEGGYSPMTRRMLLRSRAAGKPPPRVNAAPGRGHPRPCCRARQDPALQKIVTDLSSFRWARR